MRFYAILTIKNVGVVTVTVPLLVDKIIENEFVALVVRMYPDMLSPFEVAVPTVFGNNIPVVTFDTVTGNVWYKTFAAPPDQLLSNDEYVIMYTPIGKLAGAVTAVTVDVVRGEIVAPVVVEK